MSNFNSKNGGVMHVKVKTGTFGTVRVPKYQIQKFTGWKPVRNVEDEFTPIYEPVNYDTWVLKLDGTDPHANVAMRAYIKSLKGVNDELVEDLLMLYPFLQGENKS